MAHSVQFHEAQRSNLGAVQCLEGCLGAWEKKREQKIEGE